MPALRPQALGPQALEPTALAPRSLDASGVDTLTAVALMPAATDMTSHTDPHRRRALVDNTMARAWWTYTIDGLMRVVRYIGAGGSGCDPRDDVPSLIGAGADLITVTLPAGNLTPAEVASETVDAIVLYGDSAVVGETVDGRVEVLVSGVSNASGGPANGASLQESHVHGYDQAVGARGVAGTHQFLGAGGFVGPVNGTNARRCPLVDETGTPLPDGTRVRIVGGFIHGDVGVPFTGRMSGALGPSAGLSMGDPSASLSFTSVRDAGLVGPAGAGDWAVVGLFTEPVIGVVGTDHFWLLITDDGTNGNIPVGTVGGGNPTDAYPGDFDTNEAILQAAALNNPAAALPDSFDATFTPIYGGWMCCGLIYETEPFASDGGVFIPYGPQWAITPAVGLVITLANEAVSFRAPSMATFEQLVIASQSIGMNTYAGGVDDIGLSFYGWTDMDVPTGGVHPLLATPGPVGIAGTGRQVLEIDPPIAIGADDLGPGTIAVGPTFNGGALGGGLPTSEIRYYRAVGTKPSFLPYWLVPDRSWSDPIEEPGVYDGITYRHENRAYEGNMPINDPDPSWPATFQPAPTDNLEPNFIDGVTLYTAPGIAVSVR